MFSHELIEEILKGWALAPGDHKPAIPDATELHALLEFVFNVSLKTEESQVVQARLTLVSMDELKREMSLPAPPDYCLCFDLPSSLRADEIAKLARALDYRTTSIAVQRCSANAQQYLAWGLLFNSERGKRRLSDFAESYPSIEALTITAKSPGNLIIASGDRIIGRFISGEFEIALPQVFASNSLGQYLFKTVETHISVPEVRERYWNFYRETLELLLREASNRGYGGTIIWSPLSELNRALKYIDVRYRISDARDLREDLTQLCDLESRQHVGREVNILRLKRRIIERVEFVAQLSCSDGAVVMTDGFVPVCFGSIIRSARCNKPVCVAPTAIYPISQDINLSRYGARHNSAAALAGKLDQTIVFVVSEDGPVRAFRNIDDVLVLMWRDCLASLSA